MLFKGLLATDLSGSVDGITASRNAGGAYFRARAIPVQPNTPQQQTVKGLFSQLATLWSGTLTQTQRDQWTVYAQNTPITNRIGEVIFLSGLAWYQACNIPRLQAGLARVDAGPSIFGLAELTPPTVAAISAAADTVNIGFTSTDAWANEAGGALLVLASRPQSPAINFFKGPYRFAGSVPGAATPPTSPATLNLPFPVEAGQQVFFHARAVRADGRISSPFRLRGTAS